jgi:uncharacterized membrane protein
MHLVRRAQFEIANFSEANSKQTQQFSVRFYYKDNKQFQTTFERLSDLAREFLAALFIEVTVL